MKAELKVDYLSGLSTGEIKLSINGIIYEYLFDCKEQYENYVKWYGRNKGRLLNKIKSFQVKGEI